MLTPTLTKHFVIKIKMEQQIHKPANPTHHVRLVNGDARMASVSILSLFVITPKIV